VSNGYGITESVTF